MMQYLANSQISSTQRSVHVLGSLVVDLARQCLEIHILNIKATHLPLEQRPAFVHVLLAGLMLEPRLDLGACPRSAHITKTGVKPVTTWSTLAGSQNFDLKPRLELIGKRYDTPVHFRTATAVAHFGMYPVGKVDRGCHPRQVDHMPIGSEDINTIRGHVAGKPFTQITEVTHFILPLEHLAQPGDLLFVAVALASGIMTLVAPVGAYAELCFIVHGEGTNLNFQYLVFRPQHRRVQ